MDTGHEVLWSSLLIAAILLYGLLPRAVALAVSILLARRGVATTPLDFTQPYYAQLVARLAPVTRHTRVVDRGDGGHAHLATVADLDHLPPPASPGQICLLGWEIDAPAGGWPPPGTPAHVQDLGRRDRRDDLTQVIGLLKEANTALARLAVVVDVRQTPDRGVTAALVALRAAASGRLVLLFTGASALHQRVGATDAAIRQADWVQAGKAANIDATHMVAIDLDKATDADRWRLAQLLGVAP